MISTSATGGSRVPDRTVTGPKLALVALFITALVTAQIIAVKLLQIPLPTDVPGVGTDILVPAGVLAYAVTFVASDCMVEIYGKKQAQLMVNIGFAMNFVMLGLLWLAIFAPGSDAGVAPDAFADVLGLSTNIVIASLAAYIVSQHWDVYVFHRLGSWTQGRLLWVRNLGSTITSQLIDTVIFIILAFALVPAVLGVGEVLPTTVLMQLILGQYLLKLLIAALDTPVVYAIVWYIRSYHLTSKMQAERPVH